MLYKNSKRISWVEGRLMLQTKQQVFFGLAATFSVSFFQHTNAQQGFKMTKKTVNPYLDSRLKGYL